MVPKTSLRLTRNITPAIPRCTQHRAFAATSHDAPPPPERRAVVGSFLFRRHDDDVPRVALFKRSAKVNTYQHRYAAISGGVEPEDATPLKAALREIHEETGLTSDSLRYLCLGQPYSFVDQKVNYEWSVHPFAFHWPSTAEGALTLGWEHEGYAWFRPREIRESDVAGGVLESLRRVWPEGALGDVDGLCQYCLGEAVVRNGSGKDVRGDASEAFDIFASTVKEITPATNDAEQWRRQVRLAAWHVWNYSHPSVKEPLLAHLLSTLEQLEELLLPQSHQPHKLAPPFEKLVTTALDSARTRHGDNDQAADISENSPRHLAQKADRFFSALWDLR